MNKRNALGIMIQHYEELRGAYCVFANINNKRNVWWLNINITKKRVHILLYDKRKNCIHYLLIPEIHEIAERLIRKEQRYNMALSTEEDNLFTDTYSGISFRQFLIETVNL